VEERIVEFAEVLRQNGVRVSVAETTDAVRASTQIPLSERDMFRAVLRATLCKRSADVALFDRAFEHYFLGAAATFSAIDAALAARIKEEGLLDPKELAELVAALQKLAPQLAPLTQAALQGDRGRLASLFRTASLQLDFGQMQTALQTGFYSRRLAAAAGMEAMRSDFKAIEAELRARGLSAPGLEIVSTQLSAALRVIEEATRKEVQRQVEARLKQRTGSPSDRPLHTLSRAEIVQAERAVRVLAQKLKSRLVRRQRSKRKGSLNPQRTLRKNLITGGVPMVPIFRRRRPTRPDVVVLCDVSDSVRNASRMMLLFTHTLQCLFARVRSFVFVSELGEITQFFKDSDPSEAIDVAQASRVISLSANSNYGAALASFAREHVGSVTRRTTVLVIGDGRNNYNEPSTWALDDIRRRAKRLIWICTEPTENWGFGDSAMLEYSKHCHAVVTVQSVADLEQVAHLLVPT
jgi:uncharacterized protein with von Willebrand factor type A (vWA) domain